VNELQLTTSVLQYSLHINNLNSLTAPLALDSSRTFSTDENAPFNQHTKHKQRQRAAFNAKTYYEAHLASSSPQSPPPSIPYDYFHAEIADRLIDRLDDILTPDNRGFPLALEIGSNGGDFVHHAICSGYQDDLELDPEENSIENEPQGGRGGVRKLVQMDPCQDMLHRDEAVRDTSTATSGQCETYKLVADYEIYPWSFPDGTFDLVVSSMAFHWVNDLPKLLMEIKVGSCFYLALEFA
jgi:SAM-dependent methyltransferase